MTTSRRPLGIVCDRIAQMWGNDAELILQIGGSFSLRTFAPQITKEFDNLTDLEIYVRDEYAEWQDARRTG